jgi:cyclopropane-fatty-acyl-phospholipid synthase
MSFLSLGIDAMERGLVPDVLVRRAIRKLCRQRLLGCDTGSAAVNDAACQSFVQSMSQGPIAPVPEKANEQHYELPPEFFQAVLGQHRKYSCCYWPSEVQNLTEAETASLEITCERAGLQNGQRILELGCGWGSLSLWMAEMYPDSMITAVSNSAPQRKFIQLEAHVRGLTNLQIITADMNDYAVGDTFDRIVSVEMFEHMRNYTELLKRISGWLRPEGKLFVHHFCHRKFAYPFETQGDTNWMGRHFFTGGIMPNENLLRSFDSDLVVTEQWQWDGTHYEKTSNAWLANMDARRPEIHRILQDTYGRKSAARWFHRWRMFFLAVAELFGYANGQEWFVTHVLLQKKPA